MNYVVDMNHATLAAAGDVANADPGENDEDIGFIVTRQDWEQLLNSLEAACDQGPLDIAAHRKIGDGRLEIAYQVTVSRGEALTSSKTVASYICGVRNSLGSRTRVEIKFGRSARPQAVDHWIGVQGNGTSLLTGQNIWPADRVAKSPRKQLSLMFSWPFIVVLAVCKAADPHVKPSRSLMRSVLRGEQVYQNVQFALPAAIGSEIAAIALDLIVSRFRSPAFKASDDGRTLRSFDIGSVLGITGQRYPVYDDGGLEACSGVLLQKRQGRNLTTSLAIYDKAQQQRLSPQDARHRGLEGTLRFDITMRPPCMAKAFTEAKRVAASAGVELKLAVNGRGQVRCSAANLRVAIDVLDKHFIEAANGREYHGFAGWLVVRVVHDWFHLWEIFGYSRKKWRKVESWMARWSKIDRRYAAAFACWQLAEYGDDTDLKHCLKAEGLSADAAEDRLRELRKLGFSGEIPLRYWLNLDDRALIDGATYAETDQLHRRVRRGKPVKRLLATRQARMRKPVAALRKALLGLAQAPMLRSAPVVGELTTEDGEIVTLNAVSQPVRLARRS